jgi:hypothetical protein
MAVFVAGRVTSLVGAAIAIKAKNCLKYLLMSETPVSWNDMQTVFQFNCQVDLMKLLWNRLEN